MSEETFKLSDAAVSEDVDYFAEERVLARRLMGLPLVFLVGLDRDLCEQMSQPDCYDIEVAEEVCSLYQRTERELILLGKDGLLRS